MTPKVTPKRRQDDLNVKALSAKLDAHIRQQNKQVMAADEKVDRLSQKVDALSEGQATMMKRLDEIYPTVHRDIQVAEAIQVLNRYNQGRLSQWLFWLKFLGLLGVALAALVELRELIIRAIAYFSR